MPYSLEYPPSRIDHSRHQDHPNHPFLHTLQPLEFTEQDLVDHLNPMATLLDILAYIIYIIKEVAEGVEQEVRLTGVFDGFRVGEDPDAVMLDVHVDISISHHRVAVEVDGSGLLAVDVNLLGSEGLDLRVVAEGLHKQVGSNLWSIEGVEGFHDDHVHLPVLHRCTRSDIGIVAVL